MTSRTLSRTITLVLAAWSLPLAAAPDPLAPLAPRSSAVEPLAKPSKPPVSSSAPAFLRDRIDALGKAFDGRVGIAVQAVDSGWSTDWKGSELYPQQSVSKMWVAVTALDAADRGRLGMDDKVTLRRDDLTVFHQPIRELITGGGYTTTLDDLLVRAITTSDNTANDKLMRAAGGAKAVRAMIEAKKLGKIRFYDGEKALQSKIAGLIWSPRFSIGSSFWQARDALPLAVRSAAFRRYVADPYDGAAPSAIVAALARLKRGDLLSAASTRKLLSVMGRTKTGANRLKGGLRPGWTLSHKTGTGQEMGREQAGYNDIGILTAPDGKSYAVAVMIKLTAVPLPTRMTLMNNVVKAVIAQHEMTYAMAAPVR
ncbi:MAG: serine hydrolase [Sphingomicrobium sp.]